jgi:hypothetical protein
MENRFVTDLQSFERFLNAMAKTLGIQPRQLEKVLFQGQDWRRDWKEQRMRNATRHAMASGSTRYTDARK